AESRRGQGGVPRLPQPVQGQVQERDARPSDLSGARPHANEAPMPTHRPIPRPKVPKVGRPTGKFTQHRRLDVLREKLEVHAGGLSLEDLAQMLRISTRGVRRYLSELALITELESIGGSALFDEIDVALRQVQQVAHRPAARTGARGDVVAEIPLDGRFAYVPPPPRAYANRSEDVDRLFQAVVELAVLRFRYRDAGAEPRADAKDGREAREQRDQREQREQREQRDKGARITSHPYALVLHGGSIVWVAHDVDRDTARAFVFDRMTDFDVAPAERFDLPADFDIADWLHGDFGVGRAARSVELLGGFAPRAAR